MIILPLSRMTSLCNNLLFLGFGCYIMIILPLSRMTSLCNNLLFFIFCGLGQLLSIYLICYERPLAI